ncbi:MAG: hypothetical protein HC769_37500 [Cyanobacteria bacterium CRU_2_1]|nr:hypothetical protein [Cyanobacteria bacterium CRU_2_1]
MTVIAPVKRHWFGWRKRHKFTVDADVLDLKSDDLSPIVRPVPAQQQLELEVLPMISPWLLIASGVLLLSFLWLYWLMNPKSPHFARVNSVRLDGNAGTVFSGSSDRQILRWQVNNAPFQVAARRLQFEERVNQNRTEPSPADSASNLAQEPIGQCA